MTLESLKAQRRSIVQLECDFCVMEMVDGDQNSNSRVVQELSTIINNTSTESERCKWTHQENRLCQEGYMRMGLKKNGPLQQPCLMYRLRGFIKLIKVFLWSAFLIFTMHWLIESEGIILLESKLPSSIDLELFTIASLVHELIANTWSDWELLEKHTLSNKLKGIISYFSSRWQPTVTLCIGRSDRVLGPVRPGLLGLLEITSCRHANVFFSPPLSWFSTIWFF
jgi:hypothetical protein